MSSTAAEIGRRVGCSAATVSRALSSKGSVSPKTREAILKAAREIRAMDPSRAAPVSRKPARAGFIEIVFHRHSPFESLEVHGSQMTVGPLIEQGADMLREQRFHLSHSFYRQMVDAAVAETARWDRRATLQLCPDLTNESFLEELGQPDRSGVIFVGEPTPDLGAFISRCPHPLVLMDMVFDSWPDTVTTDNIAGISLAFDHVYGLGHRKIGYVGRMDSNFAARERYTTFRMKMADAHLEVRPEWVYEGYTHILQAAQGVQKILSLPQRPSALLCTNDCEAMGAVRAASALGLKVPRDLSIVGYDDIEASNLVTPPLTTVRVPVSAIGRQAVRQLMLQIQAGVSADSRGTCTRLIPELVVRGSTRQYIS